MERKMQREKDTVKGDGRENGIEKKRQREKREKISQKDLRGG